MAGQGNLFLQRGSAMRSPTPAFSWSLFLIATVCAATFAPLHGQELREHPTPFSVWLDLAALARPTPPRIGLPIWLESVEVQRFPAKADRAEQTSFRLRFRPVGELNREIQLRVFFDDKPEARPKVTGWSETGALRYSSPVLGAGLNLPTSAVLTIPVKGINYLDITVAGRGSSIRGAFVSSLTTTEQRIARDFVSPQETVDAFGNVPVIPPGRDDSYLYGRVRAALEAGPVKLEPGPVAGETVYDIQLESAPLMAVLTFEILNAEIAFPPEIIVNSRRMGPVSLHLPDLADPAFRGDVRPAEGAMRFHYTGWLRCHKLIPGGMLKAGLNRISFGLNNTLRPVAVRSVELQLKYPWQNLDYTLTP